MVRNLIPRNWKNCTLDFSRLIVEFIDEDKWEIAKVFKVKLVDHLGNVWVIEIPLAFRTNFASIPRLVWLVLSPFDRDYGKVAVLHDFGYGERWGRAFCDALLRIGMRQLNCANWKRPIIYWTVRACGWWQYYNCRRYIPWLRSSERSISGSSPPPAQTSSGTSSITPDPEPTELPRS